MFAHVHVAANDIALMTVFYGRVLGALGLERMVQDDESVAGAIWHRAGCRWPQFVVRQPFDGHPATAGNGCQVSFAATSRSVVDKTWRVAMANGGRDEGEPGVRERYAPDFYAAYCRDPEGNKLCFVHTRNMG